MKKLLFIPSLLLLALPLSAVPSSTINNNALELSKKRLLKESITELDQAINIADRKAARYYHNKGWALELQGDYAKAIENYKKALDRNKYQIVTAERLGYLLYITGEYADAVKTGEGVLKLDPGNEPVLKWLGKARIAVKEGKKKDPHDVVEKEKDKNRRDRNNYMERIRQKELSHIITVTVDVMMRTAIYYKTTPAAYTYALDHGLFFDLPESIFVNLGPFKGWTFDIWSENPWLGASIPDVNTQTAGFEFSYHFKSFYLGAGILFGTYFTDLSFSTLLSLTDFKVGFIFGFNYMDYDLKFSLYPRLLWADYPGTIGYGYDMSMFKMEYEYIASSAFTIFAHLYEREYFVFDHNGGQSNFWGTLDLTFGTKIHFFKGTSYDPVFRILFSLTERVYFRNLNNTNPYGFLNGQGFLGLDLNQFATGWPFSGIYGLGHIITVRFDEYIKPYMFLYESIFLELSDWKEDFFELNFQLGIGISI
jgi:tetratricopeptide (TPR) repeat protein